jgi:hypothetical protein
METITATTARLALLDAMQEISAGYLAATTTTERAAFMLAMRHAEKALAALE